MADDPHRKWAALSGLTRREQRVLAFLILLIAAGLIYERSKGGWRPEPLTLHRASPDPSLTTPALTPAILPSRRAKQNISTATISAQSPLDLNAASAKQLEALPGIGPVRAAAIVQHRQTYGPFRRIEDLKQVGRIGDKTLDGLRPYFKPLDSQTTPSALVPPPISQREQVPRPSPAVETSRPINLNEATAEELETLDGIGPVLARRIVEYRQRHGPFRTPADIQKVKGIGRSVFQENRHRLTVERPRK